jgi:hypothetical protein
MGVPIEQNIDGGRVLRLQEGHGVFITLAPAFNLFRYRDGVFRGSCPNKRQR